MIDLNGCSGYVGVRPGKAAARGEKQAKLQRTQARAKKVVRSAATNLASQVAAGSAAQALSQLQSLFANDPSAMMSLFCEIDASGECAGLALTA